MPCFERVRAGALALIAFLCAVILVAAEAPARRVVMVSIDGMRPQVYAESSQAKVPTIRRLMQRGAWSRGVTGVMPTVTYPSHTTMITGVAPGVHGIYDNRLADPDNTSGMAWYWYARDIKVRTLPAAVRAAGGSAAAVSWPVTVGMDLDYNVPELIQVRHRENLELVDALTLPAHLLDAYVKTSGKPLSWPIDDDDREGLAEWILGQHQPTLLLLHLADSDSMSHEHGPDSPQALAAIEHADVLLGRLLDKVAALRLDASTDVVVVSDHGFLPLTQLVNLNAAFKAEGLLQTNARGSVASWEAYAHSAGGSGYILLKRPDDPELVAKVAAVLQKLAADPANGIDRVMTRRDLEAASAHLDASFGVSMKRGFYLGWDTSSVLTPVTSKGGHGYDPAFPELRSSLVFAGPDVPQVGDLGVVSMTRIAPTVAGWLGVRLSPESAEPLTLSPSSTR
jgi:predicted AlkP superfamily pyrophosphatase or phosphodiesterase